MNALGSWAKVSLCTFLLLTTLVPIAGAATPLTLSHTGGGIVFTFSNGYASDTTAAQTLQAHGFLGTFYVGSATLRQGPYYTAYLSAGDVANLSTSGNDIGSMTVDQQDLTTRNATQLQSELSDSQAALQAMIGKPVRQLAYPFGSVNDTVASAAAANYDSARGVTNDVNVFAGAIDAYHLPGLLIVQSTTLSTAEGYVDFAQSHNVYVVLAFGGIVTSPGTYDWTPADLDALAAYVQSKNMTVSTVSQVITGASPPAPKVPNAPALGDFAGNAIVKMSWSTPYNGGSPITGYDLYRATTSGNETLFRTLPAQNNFTDTNVTNGQTYYYKVTAVNAIGEGNRSNELVATPQASILPPGARIVFTFDNGYASGTTAAQVLELHGFHGTFYASSSFLRIGSFYTDYMSGSDLASLAMRGHDIGSMTVDQMDLTKLTAAQVTAELTNSQTALQGIIGQPVRDLAYPYGAVNANVAMAAAARYDSGRTISTKTSASSTASHTTIV